MYFDLERKERSKYSFFLGYGEKSSPARGRKPNGGFDTFWQRRKERCTALSFSMGYSSSSSFDAM